MVYSISRSALVEVSRYLCYFLVLFFLVTKPVYGSAVRTQLNSKLLWKWKSSLSVHTWQTRILLQLHHGKIYNTQQALWPVFRQRHLASLDVNFWCTKQKLYNQINFSYSMSIVNVLTYKDIFCARKLTYPLSKSDRILRTKICTISFLFLCYMEVALILVFSSYSSTRTETLQIIYHAFLIVGFLFPWIKIKNISDLST